MKVQRYQLTVYEGALDYVHGMGQIQNRLYIPEKAVIGYRQKIDFFYDDPKSISDAKEIINGKQEAKYLGEIDLPDGLINKLISEGKKLNKVKSNFEQTGKRLIEIINESVGSISSTTNCEKYIIGGNENAKNAK